MAADQSRLDALVAAVGATAKYRGVSANCVRRIGAREIAGHKSLKDAVKATKNQLHQVAGAYLAARMPYDAWLSDLRAAAATDDARTEGGPLRESLRRIMASHASTRERLPVLDGFYRAVFAELPPVRSVIDVACGLNPLALPWMPLAGRATYHAYDLFTDMMAFIGQWLTIAGVDGQAAAIDLVTECPSETADVALALKIVPCLDQLDRTAALRLLDGLAARHIVVSFPARSLGGRDRGMVANYAARCEELLVQRDWRAKRLDFQGELVYIISK